MTTAEMREKLADRFPGPRWKEKVNHMRDNQVVAIYKNLERTGRLERKPVKRIVPDIYEPYQINMFGMYPELFNMKPAR